MRTGKNWTEGFPSTCNVVLPLVKLQAWACNLTKSRTPLQVSLDIWNQFLSVKISKQKTVENLSVFHCDIIQKQPSEGVPQKILSENICKSYRKTPVLESLFDKVGGLQPFRSADLLKKWFKHWWFSVNLVKFFKSFFEDTSGQLRLIAW